MDSLRPPSLTPTTDRHRHHNQPAVGHSSPLSLFPFSFSFLPSPFSPLFFRPVTAPPAAVDHHCHSSPSFLTLINLSYALDVNVERAEDVLTHKRLLYLAHDPVNRPAFDVRLVQVLHVSDAISDDKTQESAPSARKNHPPPAFGSSPNLEPLAIDGNKPHDDEENDDEDVTSRLLRPMYKIAFSTDDKPKLLSQLTSLLAEVGLNIQEAHAFSSTDGYSLDVFVVDGWPYE